METRINFNGKSISRTTVKNNIMKVYNQTTENDRQDWYQEAHDFAQSLSDESGLTLESVCGIISALSPLMPWNRNMQLARIVIMDGVNVDLLPCLKTSAKKAVLIRESLFLSSLDIELILKGEKTRSFYLNILNPSEASAITIDRHAISIAFGKRLPTEEIGLSKKQYQFFHDCYRFTAQSIGISPVILQSSTWVRWREMKKG